MAILVTQAQIERSSQAVIGKRPLDIAESFIRVAETLLELI